MTLDKKRWLSLFFGFLRILAVVGMYFLTASFGFLLALPPGNVTILWPPSGLSLAAVLAWGWPMGIGVFLGSFLVNLGTMSGPSAPVVAVFIALGSTLQSWLAAWIIRRFVGALPPVTVNGVLRVLGITVVTTLVAPLVGVTALSLAKVADWTNFFGLASAWWLGDYAGICLFTPVLYQLYLRLQKKANPDPIMWLFTSVLVGIALFSFAYLRFSEDESLKHKFNSDTETMANVLQHEIEKDTQALVALRSFFDAADSINHENFVLFTKPFLTGNTRVHALSWLPLVTDAQKTEFEQSIQRQGFPEFHIFERDAEGTNISALPRAEYFPVAYIEPLASNQAAFGFDISSNPARLRTINQARDTGLPSATAPLTLVQETGNQKGILIMMPVYKHGALVNSVETRRSNLIGMANGVFRMDDIVTGALEKISSHDIEFYVFDIDTPAGPELLAFRPAVSGIQELPKVIPNPSELETGLYNTATLDIYGRSWLILARPGPGYLIQAHGATSWVGLLAMLGLAVAFLHFWRHRQKIESKLRASEYDSQLVMNAIPDLMFRISREGVFLDYFLGEQPELYIPPAEFLGRNILDVMPADVAQKAMRAIESAFITGQAQSFEYALERDGLHFSEVRLVANKNENIVICFIRNITERIYAEQALRNSEQNFRQLAGNIQEVFWMFDMAQNTMVYISPAYEKIWNRTCESLYKNPREYFESILPEDQHIMLASLEKQTQGQKTEMEYRIWLPDGGFRWIWDRSFPVFDETGKLVRTAGLATDITVLKNSQYEMAELNKNLEQRVLERTAQVEGLYETLRASEQLYRSAITAANAVPYSRDYRSESYTFIGEGIEKITGYPPEELTPAIFDGMIKESKMRGDLAYFSQSEAVAQIRVIQSDAINATWHSDFLLQKRSGETCWVQDTSVQILDENGKLVGSIGIMQDITERKMAEDSLRESRDKLSAANAALEKASRMKDEFLASMSHELRTPLTGILGLSEALQLQTYGDLSEKQRKALNTIHTSGRHLLELINDILDLSKIEAGKLEMNLETFSVSEVCQASLQLTRGLAHQKKQDVKFEINPASITLRADPRRLKQMIVNLLSNAVKFTPEGGKIGLVVEGQEAEKIIRFTVWDNGIGIRSEDLGKLFKPFVQLDSSLARQYSGTGLGLSLVQRMAEMHGGRVEVSSIPGKGSRFTIVLPWSYEVTQVETALGNNAEPLRVVLTVEDDELEAELITGQLIAIGIENIVYKQGRGALSKAALFQPDLILLDVHLPDISGMNILENLKSDSRTSAIPVVIISAEELRAEAKTHGAAGYLVKPFTNADLLAVLARVSGWAEYRKINPVLPAEFAPVVLIADDNETVLEMFSDFLRARNFNVEITRSGVELIHRVTEIHPDILLVDIQMPIMDGLETMQRIRAHADPGIASLPMIAVTALAMSGDREQCIQAGANAYVSKPVVLDELAHLINSLLSEKK